MKKTLSASLAVALTLAVPAFAGGDVAAGQKTFNRCKACHSIVDPEGTTIVKGGRSGPNLYGIIGSQAGTVEGFRYGDSLVAAGEAGLVWDEETFLTYVAGPKKFLAAYLENPAARSKMMFRLNKGGEDVFAFLASQSQ